MDSLATTAVKIAGFGMAMIFFVGMMIFFRTGPKRLGDRTLSVCVIVIGAIHLYFLSAADVVGILQFIAGLTLFCGAAGLYAWALWAQRGNDLGAVFGQLLPTTVVKSGPYRLLRHPIYASYLLGFLGTSIVCGHWIQFATVAALFLAYNVAASQEEQALLKSPEFAEVYAAYVRRTWRWFPFVW